MLVQLRGFVHDFTLLRTTLVLDAYLHVVSDQVVFCFLFMSMKYIISL